MGPSHNPKHSQGAKSSFSVPPSCSRSKSCSPLHVETVNECTDCRSGLGSQSEQDGSVLFLMSKINHLTKLTLDVSFGSHFPVPNPDGGGGGMTEEILFVGFNFISSDFWDNQKLLSVLRSWHRLVQPRVGAALAPDLCQC